MRNGIENCQYKESKKQKKKILKRKLRKNHKNIDMISKKRILYLYKEGYKDDCTIYAKKCFVF